MTFLGLTLGVACIERTMSATAENAATIDETSDINAVQLQVLCT